MALAIAILAVIAVLPEYAADLDFALSGQISLVLGFAPLGFFAFYLWKASVTGPGRGPRSPPLTGVISGRFELHPAWNMEPPRRRVSGRPAGNAVRMWQRWCRRTRKEPVMGLGKKAKRKAKAVKGKTKKNAGKVKHKGKKAKNAAKH